MFDLRDAEMLREIVKAGGFRAAADTMGLSQSAVSNRIAALERRLGVQLFDRSRRQASLTLVGRRVLEEGERLIALRDQIVEGITGASAAGTLRLGVAETIVHTRLPSIVRALREAAPALRIELSVEVSQRLSAMLADDEIDLAVLLRQSVPPGAVGGPISRSELGWYASPALDLGDAPLTVATLARWPIVTFSRGTLPYREVERLFARPEIEPPILHGSASLATVLSLVADGTGIGTLPVEMVAGDVEQGRIVPVPVAAELVPSALDFTICRMKSLGAAVDAVIDRLHGHK
ncbi:LysR family transcriptional regulator [Acuticoccus sediminis]|uniref:LysR family transcriptional regulator n=1 Tax=Acuticoccus sediminis TaxID=2184697 RepID=UPI001CFD8874|nr:LysR family transcriptional regulator [Acuticoccus sediminis]